MKQKIDTRYSITAYHISLKERQKFYGENTKDNVIDKRDYLKDVSSFIRDFISEIKNEVFNDESSYLLIAESHSIKRTNIAGIELKTNFGKAGQDFSTIEPNGSEQQFGRETKIVKYYKLFFFIRNDGNCFMVVFRQGNNSCKTAIYNKMMQFLENTNIVVDLPYVSNNKYLEDLYNNISFVSLNYVVFYNELNNDNADDPKIVTKKYSTTSIDLSLESSKNRFVGHLKNMFMGKGNDNKKLISDLLQPEIKGDEKYSLDDNSLAVVVNINGVKRTVRIKDILSFYDIDITSKLLFDENDRPIDNSIVEEIVEYVSGIEVEELNNE